MRALLLPVLLLFVQAGAGARAAQVAERATDPASGRTYLRTPEPLGVHEADALARELGGHLVAIGSAEEETFLLDNFGAEEGYWIGLEHPREHWTSGEPVTYAHWAPGEPSGGPGEAFTVMNWSEPGAWGDARGDVATERWRAIVELPPGVAAPERVPDAPRALPARRGVLVCAIQGLQAKDLEASRNRNLNDLWKRSTWTFDAGADLSGDPLAGLGLVLWGVGSDRSRLTRADPGRASRNDTENLLSRLERTRAGVSTAALLDDPALAGILLDGRMDVRVSNASPRRGGKPEPVKEALALPTPACVVVAWTDLVVPGAEEPPEASRAKAIAAIDAELGAVLDALRARPAFADEEWLVVVTGLAPVHGRKAPAATERAYTGVPLCLLAPGIEPGELRGEVLLADLVPTALRHLGVEPRRSDALDGRALPLGAASFGADLVANGGAEAQIAWSTGPLAQLTGWRQLAPFARGRHAADAPAELGQAYLRGAGGELARAEQRIDLTPFADAIGRGDARFRFAAHLAAGGGATVECALELRDERGRELERVVLGPADGAGALRPFEASDDVPRRTRSATIVLLARGGDVREVAVDAVELVLERAE